MPSVRPRPTSLIIPPTSTTLWRAPRPPTPRRATYPSMYTSINFNHEAPPVPALSYWDPDTPSPFVSIRSRDSSDSPMNPYLAPSPESSTNHLYLFPRATPLLPASPLSMFDSPLSPRALSFLRTPTPTPTRTTFLLPASPLPVTSPFLTPSFLFPRTPPPFPERKRKVSVYDAVRDIAERKGSVGSMVRIREMMRLEFYQSLFLKRQKEMDDRSDGKKKGEGDRWKIKGIWGRLVGGRDNRLAMKEKEIVLFGGRMRMSRLQGIGF
ncbi:hypothetical protein GT037_007823 [Alternaria burnsii]|uniref:Uncharacterized protein n=1 Tax=Alternaria burnsii TaxID=1187904 RepID=A0A8H7B777_9PLEO|nr:uncharacterized protein GT037_007823 [Alternaria burnsii]KAF7674057.1 hypothetical protein GT037_007823 [Alternaria burnsii]